VAWNVVIAGGGFGGFYAARRLEKAMPRQSARITLLSDVNFLLYTPLLPGAASGTLEPRHVVIPLREELDSTNVRIGRVTGLDPDAQRLRFTGPLETGESIGYDQLIVALGSVSRVFPIPGLAEHGLGFKTIAEATALRNRALLNLEIAEAMDDPEERVPYLSFVFVGAGYAGVEGIAEMQDFVADVIERYPRCRTQGTRWVLVEALPRIMSEIPEDLAEFATRELRGRGIEVKAGVRMSGCTEDSVALADGEVIPARTLCWTAGVKSPGVIRDLGLPLHESGRIDVDATLRVKGHDNIWAVGDSAAVPDPATDYKGLCPPTAQHSMRQGKLAADNVAATLGHGKVRKFRYKTLGVFVDMGRNEAVATMLGVKLRGFPAWFAARTYHLTLMPGAARRTRLMFDWTVGLLFGRSSSELGQLGHPPDLKGYIETPPHQPASHETESGERPVQVGEG
jgi:NADH dehydrogenase